LPHVAAPNPLNFPDGLTDRTRLIGASERNTRHRVFSFPGSSQHGCNPLLRQKAPQGVNLLAGNMADVERLSEELQDRVALSTESSQWAGRGQCGEAGERGSSGESVCW